MFALSGTTAYVQPGLNITTGGTTTAPVINVVGSPIFTAVTAVSVSGTSVSATTFISGATELSIALSNKFNSAYAPISVQNQWVQPGNNTSTGGTPNAPSVNLVVSPSVFNLIVHGTMPFGLTTGTG
jgi:P pilus assembly chaperone PapD